MPSNKPHLFLAQESGFTRICKSELPRVQHPQCGLCILWTLHKRQGPRNFYRVGVAACTNVRIHTNAVNEVRKQKKGHLLSAYLRSLPAEAWKSERAALPLTTWNR